MKYLPTTLLSLYRGYFSRNRSLLSLAILDTSGVSKVAPAQREKCPRPLKFGEKGAPVQRKHATNEFLTLSAMTRVSN
jgi:hypothetical protein